MTEHTVSRDSRRVPLETRVQLKFEWFGGFISEYSSNISPGGMFIRTQTPEPVGRLIGFEFRLGDDYELIRGTGEVMWARSIEQGPDKPAGMGIRFLEISPEGRELIYRMVDNYIAEGGTPFDVNRMPAGAPGLPGSSPPPSDSPSAALAPAPPRPPAARTPAPAIAAVPALDATRTEPRRPAISPLEPMGAPVLRMPSAPPAEAPLEGEGEEEEDAPPRSRLVLWVALAGALALLAVLGVLNQDAILGWFLPGKAAPRAAAPVRHRVAAAPTPAAPSGTPAPTPAPSPTPAAAAPAPARPAAGAAETPETPEIVEPIAPAHGQGRVSEIQKITWKQDPNGTEVVLWADGPWQRQDWAPFRIDADPPRELIKVFGIRRPFATARLVVGTHQLLQVRTGYHVAPKGNELHVVLDLAGFGVEVTGIEAEGERLHIHLQGK
jgi:uncharacterized protein (TIGR02266 family)